MRLGNILAQAGGVAETGRPVRFQIRARGKGGATSRAWCNAVILPLGEDERAEALAAARAYCDDSPTADPAAEKIIQLAQRFLHDPSDLRLKFIEVKDLPLFRAGIAEDQLVYLYREYNAHIADEYPELAPPSKAEELQAQIKRLQAQLQALTEQAAGE